MSATKKKSPSVAEAVAAGLTIYTLGQSVTFNGAPSVIVEAGYLRRDALGAIYQPLTVEDARFPGLRSLIGSRHSGLVA